MVVEKVGPKTGKEKQTDSDGYRERERDSQTYVSSIISKLRYPLPPQISGTFFFELPCLGH